MTAPIGEQVVRGRAINVRARPDGQYAVTLILGVERAFGWFVTAAPIRLGALVEFHRPDLQQFNAVGGRAAAITVIRGGKMRVVPEPWTRRFVPVPWLRAVQRATTRRLYPHQIEGGAWIAQRLSRRKGCLLADDQGLGKTMQVLAGLLVARGFPAIIVCPSSLKLNWQREATEHLAVPLKITVVEGRDGPIDPAHIIVLNYELLRAREGQLLRLGAKGIVFDEAQELKKPDAEVTHRASVATRLAKAIGRRVLLTGTPMPNRPHELWRLLHIVDPHEWATYDDFKERYCMRPAEDEITSGREVVTTHGRVHNLDELHVRMAPMVLRRLKADVLKELPPKTRRSIAVELIESDREHYKRAEQDVRTWLREMGRAVRDGQRRENALLKITYLRKIAAVGKLRQAIPQYVQRYFSGGSEPLIIFGFHKVVLRGTRDICRRLGLRVGGIGSQDPPDRRQRSIDRLDAGELDVFIAPIKAAGVGINLQSASHMLFLERLWVPSAMAQAEDRCHRMGQTREVRVDYLDAVETVDEHIARVLSEKQKLIDAVVDDRERPDDLELEEEAADAVIDAVGN